MSKYATEVKWMLPILHHFNCKVKAISQSKTSDIEVATFCESTFKGSHGKVLAFPGPFQCVAGKIFSLKALQFRAYTKYLAFV